MSKASELSPSHRAQVSARVRHMASAFTAPRRLSFGARPAAQSSAIVGLSDGWLAWAELPSGTVRGLVSRGLLLEPPRVDWQAVSDFYAMLKSSYDMTRERYMEAHRWIVKRGAWAHSAAVTTDGLDVSARVKKYRAERGIELPVSLPSCGISIGKGTR